MSVANRSRWEERRSSQTKHTPKENLARTWEKEKSLNDTGTSWLYFIELILGYNQEKQFLSSHNPQLLVSMKPFISIYNNTHRDKTLFVH